MKSKVMLLPVVLVTLFAACSKDDKKDPEPEKEKISKALAKKVVTTNEDNLSSDFTYKTDSTFATVTYTDDFGIRPFSFAYTTGKRLDKVAGTNPASEQKYAYDSKGRIAGFRITLSVTPVEFIYEFTYDENDRVKEMKYAAEENGTKVPEYTAAYEYDAAGLLTKITVNTESGQKRVYTLGNYSDAFNLNPWVFLSPTGGGGFEELYNYPVLSALKKLPGKITQTISSVVQQVTTNTFTVHEGRIDKIAVDIKKPNNPQFNTAYNISFQY